MIRTMSRRLTPLASVAAIGLVAACMSSGSPSSSNEYGPYSEPPYVGPRSPCSTGPAHPWDTTFPEGPRQSPHPVCVERCGMHPTMTWGERGGVSPTMDAVPSGACSFEGEACSMVAVRPCCSPEGDQGQALLFECRCHGGTWACASTHHGGGACACGADGADGGGDASADSGDEPADSGAEDSGADAGDGG